MTATVIVSEEAPPGGLDTQQRERSVSATTFVALLWRDVLVTAREPWTFLAQVLLQPFFILFIFGRVLGDLGYTQAGFGQMLLPGIIALNGFLVALQNTALPLVMDFSYLREIEDRLLAPISAPLVAIEKILFGAVRGLLAALLMIPVGFLTLAHVSWPAGKLLPALGMLVLGSLLGASLGMVLGTLVPPRRINVLFTVALTPLMFTGCAQFPWKGLSGLRWFQVLCACNPLTYVNEGIRAVILGSRVPTIPLWIDLLVVIGATLAAGGVGVFGFLRRAID